MKNTGVKVLITNRIIWNSKQTKNINQAIVNMSNQRENYITQKWGGGEVNLGNYETEKAQTNSLG